MSLHARLTAAIAASTGAGGIGGDDQTPTEQCHAIPAAVLMAVTDRTAPGLILTLRHAGLRAHAGQVAFPGGRIDADDADAVAAALREAEEEIALPAASAAVVGTLDRFDMIAEYHVTPVLAVVPPDLPFVALEGEVAAWFEVPLSFALDPANRQERVGTLGGRSRRYLEMTWGGYRIWGATAAMIANLGTRLGRSW